MGPRQTSPEIRSSGYQNAQFDGVGRGPSVAPFVQTCCFAPALIPPHDASIVWPHGGLDTKSGPWHYKRSMWHSIRGTRSTGFRLWLSFGQTSQCDCCCKLPVMMIVCLLARFPNRAIGYELGAPLGIRNLGKLLHEKPRRKISCIKFGHALCNHGQSKPWH